MEAPSGYLNLSTNTAKSSDGKHAWLYAVIINKVGAASNILTLTDTVSGAVIGTIDTTIAAAPCRWYGGLRVPGGITATLSTGTAADVTVVYG